MWTMFVARLVGETSPDPAFPAVWTVKLVWDGHDYNPSSPGTAPLPATLNKRIVAYRLSSSASLKLHPEVNFALGGRLSSYNLDILIEIGTWSSTGFLRPDGFAGRDPSGDIRFLVADTSATVSGFATMYAAESGPFGTTT